MTILALLNDMILILKRISETIRVPDIEDFLAPVLEGGFFKKSGRIESLRILMIRQQGIVNSEYHAIINIEPDAAAKRVIKQLNRKRLGGKHINIAEHHFRHFSNDRRQNHYPPLHDRRKADRRRNNIEIIDISTERKGPKVDFSLLNLLE